jgi:hypothetical protein
VAHLQGGPLWTPHALQLWQLLAIGGELKMMSGCYLV